MGDGHGSWIWLPERCSLSFFILWKLPCINVQKFKNNANRNHGSCRPFFLPDDTTIQRMVLTEAVTFTLASQQERSMPMYAMCTEANDGAPGFDSKFKAGKMASPELLPLINFIAAHHFQNEAAQQAIWCITDKYSPYSISSEDSLISNQFRKYVCELTNVKFEKDRGAEKAAPMFRMVDGTFTYVIQKSKKVDLIIYNEAGQEIKKN